jgi:hypothetical protein
VLHQLRNDWEPLPQQQVVQWLVLQPVILPIPQLLQVIDRNFQQLLNIILLLLSEIAVIEFSNNKYFNNG